MVTHASILVIIVSRSGRLGGVSDKKYPALPVILLFIQVCCLLLSVIHFRVFSGRSMLDWFCSISWLRFGVFIIKSAILSLMPGLLNSPKYVIG